MADKNDRVGCALDDDVTDSSSLSTIGTATGDEIGCGVGFDVEGGGVKITAAAATLLLLLLLLLPSTVCCSCCCCCC